MSLKEEGLEGGKVQEKWSNYIIAVKIKEKEKWAI